MRVGIILLIIYRSFLVCYFTGFNAGIGTFGGTGCRFGGGDAGGFFNGARLLVRGVVGCMVLLGDGNVFRVGESNGVGFSSSLEVA